MFKGTLNKSLFNRIKYRLKDKKKVNMFETYFDNDSYLEFIAHKNDLLTEIKKKSCKPNCN